MKYRISKTKHLIAAEFPSVGRMVICHGNQPTYLKFPQHIFVFPIVIDNKDLVVNYHYGVSLYFRKNFKYYIPPLEHMWPQHGHMCIGHVRKQNEPIRAINDTIKKFWTTESYTNWPLRPREEKALANWKKESKETNSCSCYLFEKYKLPKLEPISQENLLEYLRSHYGNSV